MKDLLVYGLFLIAGLLVGGTWQMWKDGHTWFAVILAVLAIIAGVAGGLWMSDAMAR